MADSNPGLSVSAEPKRRTGSGALQGMFSLSAEEVKKHVDGSGTLPFFKSFRGSIVLFSSAILIFSSFFFTYVFPIPGMSPEEMLAGMVVTFIIYGVLLAFVGMRHRWAFFTWLAIFLVDHVWTLIDVSIQMKRPNLGAFMMKFFICLYACSFAWKAFLVERELRKRAAAPAVPQVPAPPLA